MEAKQYLYEVAGIMESKPHREGDVAVIRIQDATAKEIASNLRVIADGLPSGYLN